MSRDQKKSERDEKYARRPDIRFDLRMQKNTNIGCFNLDIFSMFTNHGFCTACGSEGSFRPHLLP